MARYVKSPFKLRAIHNGVRYVARVRKNGIVYNSPSDAGREAMGGSINGWWFWKYKDADGNWVRFRELRIKHR